MGLGRTGTAWYVPEYCGRTRSSPFKPVLLPAEKVYGLAESYKRILKFIPPGFRGIDVASGMGIGTGMLAEHSKEVIGIEISEARIAEARVLNRSRNNIHWIHRDLDQLEHGDHLWPSLLDYVVCMDTIEHLFNPERLLAAINQSLPTGGLLIISVPTCQTTDINPFHLQDFTLASFRKLVKKAGFRIEREFLTGTLRPLGWANPFKKEGRILPNIVPKEFLFRNMLEVYQRNPLKFFNRIYTLVRYQGFPGWGTILVAQKVIEWSGR